MLPLWSAWQIVQHNNKHTTTCNNNSNDNNYNNKCATESNNDNNHKSESLLRWLCRCRSCRTSPSSLPLSFALCVLKPQTPSIRMPLCYVGCCSRSLGHDLIKVLHVLSRFYSLPTSYSLSLHLRPVNLPHSAPPPPPLPTLPLPTLTGP